MHVKGTRAPGLLFAGVGMVVVLLGQTELSSYTSANDSARTGSATGVAARLTGEFAAGAGGAQQAAVGVLVELPLDDGAGTTASDASGNDNDGTLVNGPAWTNGRLNGGLAFDGLNDALAVGPSASIDAVSTS